MHHSMQSKMHDAYEGFRWRVFYSILQYLNRFWHFITVSSVGMCVGGEQAAWQYLHIISPRALNGANLLFLTYSYISRNIFTSFVRRGVL